MNLGPIGSTPNRDQVFGADPAGLAGFEGEVPPAEKCFVDTGETAGGEGSGLLRDVGLGRNRAKNTGAL